MAPGCQVLAQIGIRKLFLAFAVARLLKRQRLAEDEAASPGETAHGARLVAIGHQFKFEGLKARHESIIQRDGATVRAIHPRPEGRGFSLNLVKVGPRTRLQCHRFHCPVICFD